MGKYFGTDGFRGEANKELTADHAYRVGRFLGWYYGECKRRNGDHTRPRIVIGKDTRRGCVPSPCHHDPVRCVRRAARWL